ncbi:protein big brother-like isoform X2 [Penaeus japonicus]|uniref:protein big brother-like isoform X2 n=1 Tax=Penaeus japonicus TaxID=27405 RepID=UPI001C711F18|nr:protein big brother-like isoform X2 [Penaeus japonicus]
MTSSLNEQMTVSTTMLPHYDSPLPTLYEPQPQPPKPRLMFKMPRVVPDQKSKFESDELFRRLARETEVRYTGYRDRPMEERRQRFQAGVREGHTEVAFMTNGTNMCLQLSTSGFSNNAKEIDFDKEPGKVHLRSPFIMNGVCVRWRGYVDLERLDGVGCLEFDEESAAEEDRILREEIEKYKARLREFEEKQRAFRVPTTSHAHSAHTHPHAHAHPHAHTEQANIQILNLLHRKS